MEKFFTTEGAVQSDIHYCLDPLRRINIDELETLINARKYFVLHAPRQTGKTTSLLALRDYLNQQGRYVAVYANVEVGQAYRNEVSEVQKCVVEEIGRRLSMVLKDEWPKRLVTELIRESQANLSYFMSTVCTRLSKPLVLFLDEIDALVGDSLVSVLRSLRSGYDQRPEAFPQSVILCGVRDVTQSRIELSDKSKIMGGSAFNICSCSLRLPDFTTENIRELYLQHTSVTGQAFDESCFPLIWEATEGVPGLVNAMAHELTDVMSETQNRNVHITSEMVIRAKEKVVHDVFSHDRNFIAKLNEESVRRVLQTLLVNHVNEECHLQITDEDIRLAENIGLVKRDKPLRISNGIYQEVINLIFR